MISPHNRDIVSAVVVDGINAGLWKGDLEDLRLFRQCQRQGLYHDYADKSLLTCKVKDKCNAFDILYF